jgi:hypothetical protein
VRNILFAIMLVLTAAIVPASAAPFGLSEGPLPGNSWIYSWQNGNSTWDMMEAFIVSNNATFDAGISGGTSSALVNGHYATANWASDTSSSNILFHFNDPAPVMPSDPPVKVHVLTWNDNVLVEAFELYNIPHGSAVSNYRMLSGTNGWNQEGYDRHVPEPASLLLFGFGLVAAASRLRRRT